MPLVQTCPEMSHWPKNVEIVQDCFTLIEGEGLRAQRDYHTKQTMSAMDEQGGKELARTYPR
jgi:hypothetical protein